MNLKIAIIDDEKHNRDNLKELLEEFCTEVDIVGVASSIDEGITIISKTKPDVIFLDIELRKGTGFDMLNQIKNIDFDVIFITAFEQYAIKAIKFSSLDYLLKPIDIEELQKSVEKAKKKKNQEVYKKQLETLMLNLKQQKPKLNKICLATIDGFEFLNIHDILYCKGNGSYTSFILKNNNSLLVSKHLKEYENLLLEQDFMRVHNSFLINLKEVKKYIKSDGGYIIMNNDDLVNISRSKKEVFLKTMTVLTR